MHYRQLGRSGLKVSPICLGTMMFGGPTDDASQTVVKSHHIAGWDGFPLAAWLTGKRKEEVRVVVPEEGEEAKLVRLSVSNARFLLDDLKIQKLKKAGGLPFGVTALQKDLRLAVPPRRIECFDISNTQGSDSVASMVVFTDGKPRRSDYRKFKIGSVEGPDDFASMREVIRRRYTRVLEEQGTMPDLIMVDGGKGQLSSAVEVLAELGLVRQAVFVRRVGSSEQEVVFDLATLVGQKLDYLSMLIVKKRD